MRIFRSEREEVEREIVPFLLKMARLPKGTPARRILDSGAGGALGARLEKARSLYSKSSGSRSIAACLDSAFAGLEGSWRTSFFLDTAKVGIENNFDTAGLVSRAAAELRKREALEEKRAAALAVQKYTLVAAGAFFVPFMLGATAAIIRMLASLGSGLAYFGFAISGTEALPALLLTYSLILPLISAAFISVSLEGRRERLLPYSAAMAAAAAGSFAAASALLGG